MAFFHQPSPSASPFASSPRIPLQDLPISPSGEVLGARCPTLRPIPCSGEENVSAFRDAMQSRYRYYTLQLADLTLQSLRLRHLEEQLQIEDSVLPANTMTNDAAALPHTRLSMPEISDDSDSEPDISALGMARERLRAREGATQQAGLPPRFGVPSGRTVIPGQLQDTSIEDEDEDDEDEDLETVDDEEEEHEGEQEAEEMVPLIDPAAMGLKEISNLGRFTVSSHKQGNGVEELRSDDLNLYWQ
jgi:anaphase-promoting complex subunit 10